jgi:hypothetical protein
MHAGQLTFKVNKDRNTKQRKFDHYLKPTHATAKEATHVQSQHMQLPAPYLEAQ